MTKHSVDFNPSKLSKTGWVNIEHCQDTTLWLQKRLLVLKDHQRCVVAWERAVAPDRQVTLNKTLDTLLLSSHYPDPLSLIQPDDPIPIPSAQLTSLTRNLPLSYLNPRAASLWLLDSQCLAVVCVPSFQPLSQLTIFSSSAYFPIYTSPLRLIQEAAGQFSG